MDINSLRMTLESNLNLPWEERESRDWTGKPLVLLGSGSVYAQPFVVYAFEHLRVVACVDNLRRGQQQGDLVVQGDETLSELVRKHPDAIGVLCCQSDAAVAHFTKKWSDTGHPLINMFQIMRESGHPGSEDYYSHFQNTDLLIRIYEECWFCFNDLESQRSLLSVLLFRATLAQPWLESVRLPYDDMYFFTSGLDISDDEVFVDAGSFDGDSITQFLRRVGSRYGHIHAMEPDPLNFEQLRYNFDKLPRSTLHECGLWSQPASVRFQINGLGSYVDAGGTGPLVRLEAMDNMDIGPVTLLKMDIEGAEISALQGAQRTILRDKPKLAIAAYHKRDDLPCLINTIRSIRDDYRFTLRHHSPFFRDTVLMAE